MSIRTRTRTHTVGHSSSASYGESVGVGASWSQIGDMGGEPPLHAIVHELREAVRAQRDHLDDMLVIFCRLETALLRLASEGGRP